MVYDYAMGLAQSPWFCLLRLAIRQDAEGRYCLNDLYKASGGAEKDKPYRWLRNYKTKELIDRLEDQKRSTKNLEDQNRCNKPLVTLRGRGITGTYVCEELVYDYAMWISPEFKLKVIRAFDTLQTQGRC